MSPDTLLKRIGVFLFSIIFCLTFSSNGFTQLRKVYTDTDPDNHIKKISFYSASSGYVAFQKWIGFTTDSGRTFTKKFISIGNVDFNGYLVNHLFGFYINGVQAFSQSNILVYGDYGQVPSILHSTDGGDSYRLIFHSKTDAFTFSSIRDMNFSDANTGFAVDDDRILKTTDKGMTWSVRAIFPRSYFDVVRAIDNSNAYAYGSDGGFAMRKTNNGGASWQSVTLPGTVVTHAFFLDANKGWIEGDGKLFYTMNAGSSWKIMNGSFQFGYAPFQFTNDSTGYQLSGADVYKTTDSGKVWEPLPRDNNLNHSLSDFHFLNDQHFWTGGSNGFLQMTSNAGGTPLPISNFKIDTTGYLLTRVVTLLSLSKSSHQHKWYLNGTLISNANNVSYTKTNDAADTIQLIVTNGTASDTLALFQHFQAIPVPSISSFSPTTGPSGTSVTINGENLQVTNGVSFGGTTAGSFSIVSSTRITAVVSSGSSGTVSVTTPYGIANLAGFTFIPAPVITSITPSDAAAGDTIRISGVNLTGASSVTIGGISVTSFLVTSSTSILALVPSGPSGPINVTTPGGTVSFGSFISRTTITGHSPNSGTKGTLIKITGTSLNNVTSVLVGGSPLPFKLNSSTSLDATVGQGNSGSIVVVTPTGNFTLGSFAYVDAPTIFSVSSSAGPINSQVTIVGTNFHPIASNNIVYFGGVRATVIGGSSSSLTVTVPPGASSNTISVTANHLTAFSSKTFIITFPDGGTISSGSLEKPQQVTAGVDRTPGIFSMADIDGDGKNDMVFDNYSFGGGPRFLSIMRNRSENGQVIFDPPTELLTASCDILCISDFDGDGKLDIAFAPEASPEVVVLRNISNPGQISFEPVKSFSIPGANPNIISGDLDLDGKVDLILAGTPLGFLKNVSDLGNIQFNPMTFESALRGQFSIADVNGDGKHDIAGRCDEGLCIVKNNSVDSLSLSQPIPTGGNPNAYSVGDIDGDGKMDVVSLDDMDPICRVIKNIGVNGEISFDLSMTLQTEISPTDIALQDMDGDGRLDIVCSNVENDLISIFKNTSNGGNISFGPRVDYHEGTFYSENTFTTGDVNQDGKPDIIANPALQENHLIFINKVNRGPYIEYFTPTVGVTGTAVTIRGFNFNTVTSVSFGGTAAQSFSIVADTVIVAIVGNGSSGDISVGSSFPTASKKGFQYGAAPVITSFTPVSGPVGTTVTIHGSGFDLNPSNNIVYFGGGKAKVLSASSSSLTVVAPAANTVAPITVTTNRMTAYSSHHFTLKFQSGITDFNDSTFKHAYSTYNVTNGIVVDVDADGKLDLVYLNSDHNSNNYYFAVKRNSSTRGSFSFEPEMGFFKFTGNRKLFSSDVDGDGLHDVVVLNIDVNTFSIFKNTSSTGNISFAERIDFTSGLEMIDPTDLTVMDVNLDGKPEIIVTNNESQTVSVFKNITTNDSIRFETAKEYPTTFEATTVILRDLNYDQKPEMIVSGSMLVSVLKNTSSDGLISFEAPVGLQGAGTHLQAADFDLDGRTDLAIGNSTRYVISTLRNVTANGSISFETEENYEANLWPTSITIGDLNGDARAEIIAHNSNFSTISLFQNLSSSGNMEFGMQVQYTEPFFASVSGSVADMDGDGITDLVLFGGWGVNIYKTETISMDTVDVPLNGNVTLITNVRGTSYQWQEDRGNGFVNLSDNINISGSQNDSLQLINVPGSLSGYMYRCIVDGDTSRVFLLNVTCTPVHPVVNISTPATSICTATPVTFTAMPVNGGSSPSFQWTVNGAPVGTNSTTFATSSLVNGDIIKVSMRSNAVCQSDSIWYSNAITMSVSNALNPSVTIASAATSICPGTNVQFTASPSNAGSAPIYQWKKNGINVGTNSPTYSDNTLRNSDVISLALTSNAYCVSNPVAVSNNITMTVTNGNTPNVTITSSKNEICEGEGVTFLATPEFGGTAPSYRWFINGVNVGSQSNAFGSSVLTNGARIVVVMTSDATCISKTTDTSNSIVMTVNTRVTPKVEISGPTLVNRGEFTILNAVVTNGGNSPILQWQDSINNTGWKDIPGGISKSLIYSPLVNGTRVRCKLVSDALCATVGNAISQELVFTINMPTAIDPDPAETHGIRAFPNPVTDFLILDSLKLSDKWETAEVISLDGRQRLVVENIRNKTSVKIPVQKLSKGFYAAELRRRNDAPVYIRFIKM